MNTRSPQRYKEYKKKTNQGRKRKTKIGCIKIFIPVAIILIVASLLISAYLLFPQRVNVLLLGLDYSDPTNAIARTDTIILSTFVISDGYIGLLSIPRDLWVYIPDIGYNRINSAHFFAEASDWGSGPSAVTQTVVGNFGVDVDYYVRVNFQGFRDIVDAMGGLDIEIPRPMAGYEAGKYHLTGRKALAFTRNRLGSDDFFRMERGQIVLKALYKQITNPKNMFRLPAVAIALHNSIDTNIPGWLWPRLIFTLLRSGMSGLDNRVITRDMTSPTITDSGANVLIPRWELINPTLKELFNQK